MRRNLEDMSFQAEAVVNLDALASNTAKLAARAPGAAVMAAVKADGYGHGMVPAARASLEGGATWLGVATLDEAMALREAGIDAPTLAWLVAPGLGVAAAADAGVDLGVSSLAQLREIAAAGARRPARVHLKADTGMGRGGVPESQWGEFVEAAAKSQADGAIEVVGAWSHLACADEPAHPANAAQQAGFTRFLDAVAAAELQPRLRHLANSAALLSDPRTHYDLVRPGIAVYGYTQLSGGDFGLTPAMSLRARLVLVKPVPAGQGISYGHSYVAETDMEVGIAPIGYADGVPRTASGRAWVNLGGRRRRVLGRICMDQFAVDATGLNAAPGDVVELFGPDVITADDWADWQGTISNEILTSIGARAPRRYVKASR